MSREATNWVWSLAIKAPQKLLLLSLADRADEDHRCFPSIQRLVKDTGLDKKTIGKWINLMIEDGLISDTGERKGSTKRVRILQLNITSELTQKRDDSKSGNITKNGSLNAPKNGSLNAPKNGSLNAPKNGSLNAPKNGSLNVPKNGLQNQSVESINESINESNNKPPLPPQGEKLTKKVKFDPLSAKPENVSDEVWLDWINFRKEIKKPLTETMCKQQAKKLAGVPNADSIICESIANGWQGLFPGKASQKSVPKHKQNSHVGFSEKNYKPMMNWTTRQDHDEQS